MPVTYEYKGMQFQGTGDPEKDYAALMERRPDIAKQIDPNDFKQKVSAAGFGQGLNDQPAATQSAPGRSLPADITQIRDYANQFPPTSKQYQAYQKQYEDARDDYLKLNPVEKARTEEQQKEENRNKTVDDIKNAMGLLKQIETYSGWKARPNQWVQGAGEFLGMNPEVSAYNQKVGMLLAPIAKGIQGDSGNLSEFEQKAAKEFFPMGKQLYSKELRSYAIQNLIDSVKARTGRDLSKEFSPEELAAMGYEGNMGNQANAPMSTPQAQSASPLKPTHRFNPVTGKIEPVQ